MAVVALSWVLSKGANLIVGIIASERVDSFVEALNFELKKEKLLC